MNCKEYIIPIGEEAKEFDEMFIGVIRKQPELIRCKDCKHYDDKHEVCCVYLSYRLAKNEDDFCSDAEREEE